MSTVDAAATAKRWADSMARAGDKVRAGVEAVTVSPGERAIAAKANYANGVQRALSDGSFERGNRSYTVDAWKRRVVTIGVARMGQGAQAALDKMTGFMGQWLPLQAQLSERIKSMPKGTLADSVARSTAAIEFNAALKGRFKRGG